MAWVLVLLAGAQFWVRGPMRLANNPTGVNDFFAPYVQATAWKKGLNPYDATAFVREWPADKERPVFLAKEAAAGTLAANHGIPSPYPITTFALFAPLSFLPWPAARALWSWISLASFLVTAALMISAAGRALQEIRSLLFVAALLAFAPFHTGLATGNPIVLTVGLGVAAVWLAERGKQSRAGILIGIAVCFKPQIGIVFLLYYAIRRNWRTLAVAAAVAGALTAVAAGRVAGTHWQWSFLALNRAMLSTGAVNDFTPANPVWFHMINLQVLFYGLWANRSFADVTALGIGLALLAAWAKRLPGTKGDGGFLPVAALTAMSLLPVYHRFYDAGLLIFALAWCIMEAVGEQKKYAWAALATMIPFLAPGAAALNEAALDGRVPPGITQSWWWTAMVMPHQALAVLATSVVLVAAMGQRRTATAG
jgi:hypothetical protein